MTDTRPNFSGIPRSPLPPGDTSGRTTLERHTASGRAARRRPWIALGLSLATLFMASWIVIPAPNRTLLPLSVGAPEICVWLILMALVGIVGAVRTWHQHIIARVAIAASVLALILALIPLLRFPAVASRTVNALQSTLGVDYLDAVPFDRQLMLRPTPLDFSELFRGLPKDSAIVSKGIVFATVANVKLTGIVYQPPVKGNFPIVVQIYGGAWQRGTADDFPRFAKFLASHGYVVFAIDYRHAPQFTFHDQYADVKTALSWVRRSAAKFGGDTTRVALLGRSAGAHLSLMAGYDSALAPVKAIVNFYGPVDLVESYLHPPSPDPLNIRDVETKFIGVPMEKSLDKYQEASPVNHVRAGLPPTLLIYGGRDNVVESRYGALLNERLRAAGNKSVFIEIPWADHAFDDEAISNGLSGQLSRYAVERFLAWALTRQTP